MNDRSVVRSSSDIRGRRATWAAWAILSAFLVPSTVPAEVSFGVQAGANVSRLRYEEERPAWHTGWRASFTGGAEIVVPIKDRLSLLTGPRYVRQTHHVKYDTGNTTLPRQVGEFQITQDYVSLPVLLAIRPLASRRVFFCLGPEAGLLLAGRLIGDDTQALGASTPTAHRDEDIKDKLKSANLTIDAGLGIEFPVSAHVAVTSVRYTHGVVGVAKKGDWISDWKTQGVEGLLGFRW